MNDDFVLGLDADYDEHFEKTALTGFDFEDDEVTELLEQPVIQNASSDRESSRISFMSSLFRTI